MKSTGIVRKLDELGRIVLPIEIRKTMDIKDRDGVEIFIEDNKIILKKHVPACIFCGSVDNVTYIKEKLICKDCFDILIHSIQ